MVSEGTWQEVDFCRVAQQLVGEVFVNVDDEVRLAGRCSTVLPNQTYDFPPLSYSFFILLLQ